jgi:hypothetical protein
MHGPQMPQECATISSSSPYRRDQRIGKRRLYLDDKRDLAPRLA